jgi:hypothetical protein
MNKDTQIKGMANPNRGSVGVQEAQPQRTEQEPVAHLWQCLGRWSVYLVNNGTQADCAPPSWLVEAVRDATTPPQRKPLTDEQITTISNKGAEGGAEDSIYRFVRAIEAAHGIKENT